MGDAVVGEGIRGRDGSNLKGRLWRCHPSLEGIARRLMARDVSAVSNLALERLKERTTPTCPL